jgi:recombination associated protein RdgC
MFFKNAIIYTYSNLPEMDEAMFQEQMFVPCSDYQFSSTGFVVPLGFPSHLNLFGDLALLCINIEEKILPAEVVRRKADEVIERIEEKEQRKMYRKERKQIQDDVTASLLPQAFTKHKRVHAVFDLKNHLLIVDASSENQADKMTNLIRNCTGSLPVKPIECKYPVDMGIAGWFNANAIDNNLPSAFRIGEYARLAGNGGEVHTLKGEPELIPMGRDLIAEHNMYGAEIELIYQNLVRVVFTKSLGIKGIKFLEFKEEDTLEENPDESDEQRAQADILLSISNISKIILSLCSALGGSGFSE